MVMGVHPGILHLLADAQGAGAFQDAKGRGTQHARPDADHDDQDPKKWLIFKVVIQKCYIFEKFDAKRTAYEFRKNEGFTLTTETDPTSPSIRLAPTLVPPIPSWHTPGEVSVQLQPLPFQ